MWIPVIAKCHINILCFETFISDYNRYLPKMYNVNNEHKLYLCMYIDVQASISNLGRVSHVNLFGFFYKGLVVLVNCFKITFP